MAISEKSTTRSIRRHECEQGVGRTLSVEEVADGDRVASLRVHRSLLEHLIDVLLGANAHVLLAEGLDVLANVCALLR